MRIDASPRFRRRAAKLRPPHNMLLEAAIARFARDPRDPLLRTHKLKGDLSDYWTFSVDDDLRVLFRWEGETCFLISVGSHDEIH